jgi:hypothetical protein
MGKTLRQLILIGVSQESSWAGRVAVGEGPRSESKPMKFLIQDQPGRMGVRLFVFEARQRCPPPYGAMA